MKEALVSVVMPAYNAEKYIEQAIRSVQNQSYSNWELLICDDCSSDNTTHIIKK
jgi:teichuronic acid biosynthesis glycosyltransferase TuaG